MIKKFQQGGQQQQQLDQIFTMINQQPEEALKQLAQSGAKPKDIAKLVQVGVQQGKIKPEIGQAIMQALQGQVATVKHGAKLQYIKSLKNKCADDEELYYYKKGGSIGCGCKKKEEGGEIKEAKCGAVAKFKEVRKAEPGMKMMQLVKANKDRKVLEEKKKKQKGTWAETTKYVPGKTIQRGNGGPDAKVQDSAVPKEDVSSHNKRKNNYYTSMAFKKGDKIVKAFKEKCGAKMKKK